MRTFGTQYCSLGRGVSAIRTTVIWAIGLATLLPPRPRDVLEAAPVLEQRRTVLIED